MIKQRAEIVSVKEAKMFLNQKMEKVKWQVLIKVLKELRKALKRVVNSSKMW